MDYEKFFDILDDIVGENYKNWQTKKADLEAAASPSDLSNLEELAGWFSGTED